MALTLRTFSLMVALLAAICIVGWQMWQPGADGATSPASLAESQSIEWAPALTSSEAPYAEGMGAKGLDAGMPPFVGNTSERTAVESLATLPDATSSAGGLRGIVIDMQGQPVANAVVVILDPNASPGYGTDLQGLTVWKTRRTNKLVSAKTETDGLGRFELPLAEVAKGQTIQLAIDKPDYLLVSSFPVEDSHKVITIQLEIGASITLPVITWPAIERDENTAVRLAYQTQSDPYSNRVVETLTLTEYREQAEQTFVGLPADTYVIEVVVGPGRWLAEARTVTVQDGEHVELEPAEIGAGFMAYDLQVVDQHQRPIAHEALRVDYVNTGLTAFGVPITDADGITFFVLPNNLGPLRMKSYNNGAANLSPSFGTRVSKEGGSRVLTFMLTL